MLSYLKKRWRQSRVFERILFIALSAGLVSGIVCIVFGFTGAIVVLFPFYVLLALVQFGYAIFDLMQLPLARRRERTRARLRDEP